MFTPGNRKLGRHLIWGFGLPSGTAAICVGMTPACRRVCYSARMEGYRRTTLRRFRRNATLARRPDFALRVRAFLIAHHVRVARIHVGGDFYSPEYAATWLAIIRRSRRVRFFFYTRAWRDAAIKVEIDRMAAEPNC